MDKNSFKKVFEKNTLNIVIKDIVFDANKGKSNLIGGIHNRTGNYYVFDTRGISYLVPKYRVDDYGHVILEKVQEEISLGKLPIVNLKLLHP